MTDTMCIRHPDREASYAVVMHYLSEWRSMIGNPQVLDPLCAECRLDLIRWMAIVIRRPS